MAKYGQKLEMSSFTGEIPTLNLCDEKWSDLISIIQKSGQSGGGEQSKNNSRAALKSICDKYLEHRTYEIKAIKASDYQKLLDEKKKVGQAAAKLAQLYNMPNKTDSDRVVATEFERLWSKYFRLNPMHLDFDAVVERDKDSDDWKLSYDEDNRKRFGVRLNHVHLCGIAIQISSALKIIEEDFSLYKESNNKLFYPGVAFQKWIDDVKQWAKANDYYHGYSPSAYADKSEPSQFANFAFKLHNLFPDECSEEQMANAVAMGKRIKRVCLNQKRPK